MRRSDRNGLVNEYLVQSCNPPSVKKSSYWNGWWLGKSHILLDAIGKVTDLQHIV